MACVMYWTTCNKCKDEDYVRYQKAKCEKCGHDDVSNHREWDEENDHND